MMVLEVSDRRGQRHDTWLGGLTAAVAGLVNVCSVVAFFAFGSNITGHVAIFAEELVKGHWHQVSVVCSWFLLFVGGAFCANLSVTVIGAQRPRIGRAVPLVLEAIVLIAVGYYGEHHYGETLRETEYLVGTLLLAMGLQNGLVATVSRGVVKTTHLTGLATDLGMELSMMLQPRFRQDAPLRFKLSLHLTVLLSYVLGGVGGGLLFLDFGFRALYVAGSLLLLVLVHDIVALLRRSCVAAPGALLHEPLSAWGKTQERTATSTLRQLGSTPRDTPTR
jgi:uncharacterized membrane protein YoaK (UPF0700 family)